MKRIFILLAALFMSEYGYGFSILSMRNNTNYNVKGTIKLARRECIRYMECSVDECDKKHSIDINLAPNQSADVEFISDSWRFLPTIYRDNNDCGFWKKVKVKYSNNSGGIVKELSLDVKSLGNITFYENNIEHH